MNNRLIFQVVDLPVTPILGKDSCEKLKLIARIQELKIGDEMYEGLGCVKNVTYDIDLIQNPSFEICPARKVPYGIRDEVKKRN